MNCDIAIIGGGLAGLSLSIDMKRRGYQVSVIEKGNYPRHKVCGEYISLESHNYLQTICPALSGLNLPMINQFKLTSGNSKEFTTQLSLGGFGISRYLLEDLLFKEAEKQGVKFLLHTKSQDISGGPEDTSYTVKTSAGNVTARIVCNTSGRKSNLKTSEKINNAHATNYVGVKYHLKLSRNRELIEIHNFPGGYCGISGIEEGKSCLCYIVNSKKLNKVNNSITELEKTFLFRNPNLEKIFTAAEFVFKEPITISGINFLKKVSVTDNAFCLGDSAGSMAPIVGNGMSMALRSAAAFAEQADQYFSKVITKQQLVKRYAQFWEKEFSARIRLSRYLQKLSEYPFLTKRTIELFNLVPPVANLIIRQTHGHPF